VIVLDSSAIIAILRNEPEADSFIDIIAETDGCLLSAVSLQEASMVLAGRRGAASSWTELDEFIAQPEIQVVAHDARLAMAAREAFLRYGKGRHPAGLNMGDCAAYALAQRRSLPLLFKGNDFPATDLMSAA
jgi:ribonuclease VapC